MILFKLKDKKVIKVKRVLLLIVLMCSNMLFANVAIVKTMSGKVEVKRAKKIISLKVGSMLENGDIIRSKSKSSIGISFNDGSLLSLGEKAIFIIKKFKVKPEKKEYDVDLDLKKGKAIFTSGKVGKLAPKSVKFRVPEGIIGIRGTKFAVEVK
jgi:hypothetical protein